MYSSFPFFRNCFLVFFLSLKCNMDQLFISHPDSLFLICGDFNYHHANWQCVGTSLISHGTSAKDFCDSMGLTRSVNLPTWISFNGKYSFLDLRMTNFPANVSCSSSSPIGSSDLMLVRRLDPARSRWSPGPDKLKTTRGGKVRVKL